MLKDKRRFPRQECRGTASIQITPDEPLCTARVLDLSMGGCLMEFQDPVPLAIDTKVELIFSINNLPFRVQAKVRSTHTPKKIGFQFVHVLERTRLQLADMIDEIRYSFYRNYPRRRPTTSDASKKDE